jgi:hypothetical protein
VAHKFEPFSVSILASRETWREFFAEKFSSGEQISHRHAESLAQQSHNRDAAVKLTSATLILPNNDFA